MMNPAAGSASHVCLHCNAPTADDDFCCSGCRFIYQTIHGLGLGEFYRYRSAEEAARATAPDAAMPVYESYDHDDFRDSHLNLLPSGNLRGVLHLSGIHCAGCVWLIEKLPQLLAGVRTARLNFADANLELTFDPARIKLSEIASFLHSLGYPSCPLEEDRMADAERKEERVLLLRLGIAGFAAANTMLLAVSLFQGLFTGIEREYAELLRRTSMVLAIPAVFYSALPFYRAAFGAIIARRFHIDLPISIAILVAFFLSAWNTAVGREHVYFDSAAALVFLLLASRYIQRRALQRARREARAGWSFLPSAARLIAGGTRRLVSLRALKEGDVVEVLPGERFPSDGVIEQGESSVDLSVLTGESLPDRVSHGGTVFGGTLNISAPLQVRIRASFATSRVGRLLDEMSRGERRPARFLSFTERVSAVFVVTVVVLAVITLVSRWQLGPRDAIETTLALLIVTCPCALALASPLMMALAVSRAARRGILIKHVDSLERLTRVKEIYLDKTGTLTRGVLTVSATFPERPHPSVLDAGVALAALTPSHPVSAALLRSLPAASRKEVHAEHPELVAGRGVRAQVAGAEYRLGSRRWMEEWGVGIQPEERAFIEAAEAAGSSISILAHDRRIAALFRLDDQVKPEAEHCLSKLTGTGRAVFILSGDRSATVRELGARLRIPVERCFAEKYPEEKRDILRSSTSTTAMVGDGLNDGGALQSADVGIAVAGGIQPNIEVADIIIPDGDLDSVGILIDGAHNLFRRLRAVLALSAVYNLCGAALAMAGMMNPLIAALIMPLSSVTVIGIALYSDPFSRGKEGGR